MPDAGAAGQNASYRVEDTAAGCWLPMGCGGDVFTPFPICLIVSLTEETGASAYPDAGSRPPKGIYRYQRVVALQCS